MHKYSANCSEEVINTNTQTVSRLFKDKLKFELRFTAQFNIALFQILLERFA